MSLVPLLILPLVGGYAFSIIWYPSLYRASRESGHRLYFRAAFYGFFISVVAFLLHVLLFQTDAYKSFLEFGCSSSPALECKKNAELLGKTSLFAISFISILLGPSLGHLLNQLLPGGLKRWLVKKAVKDNDFESLILCAFEKKRLLLITLSSNKVYVGWAVSAPNPVSVRKYLRILPYLSGYRDQETHELEFTTDYYNILNRVAEEGGILFNDLKIEDFEVVIPTEEIIYSHIFDVDAFISFDDDFESDSKETSNSDNAPEEVSKD